MASFLLDKTIFGTRNIAIDEVTLSDVYHNTYTKLLFNITIRMEPISMEWY